MTTYHLNLTERCNLDCKFCYAKHSMKDMSKEILDKSIDYILEHGKNADEDDGMHVEFVGRELGLIDPMIINYAINRFENESTKSIETSICSNLAYRLTETQLKVFKRVDFISTSYDYADIRFRTIKQRLRWFKNIKLLQSLGFDVNCTTMVYKQLIQEVRPQMLFDFMLSTGIKKWELMRICQTLDNMKDIQNKSIVPTNRERDLWLKEAYLIYKAIQKEDPEFSLQMFDCIDDSIKGIYYYDHRRGCQLKNITFGPDGKVSQCAHTQNTPFLDLKTGIEDKKVFNDVVAFEQKVNDECLKCEYYKYCRGDCCFMDWDETGCPTPKSIYEYILKENK